MKIFKFYEFIKENISDVPENYIDSVLNKLKIKIDKLFDSTSDDTIFKDMNLDLESSEISKYSKLQDCLKVKFSDGEFLYDLTISIDLKEAIPKEGENFSDNDIKNCFVRFKKYDTSNFNLIGQITKNEKIEEIGGDFLIRIKLELDESLGDSQSDNEEFEIET